MTEFVKWLVIGFGIGVGFTLAQLAVTGTLSLIGRGKAVGP